MIGRTRLLKLYIFVQQPNLYVAVRFIQKWKTVGVGRYNNKRPEKAVLLLILPYGIPARAIALHGC